MVSMCSWSTIASSESAVTSFLLFSAMHARCSPTLDRDSKTSQNQVYILQYICYFHENFCGVSGKQMEQVTLLTLCTLRLHREEPVQVTNVMAILWLHEKSRIKNTCLVSY